MYQAGEPTEHMSFVTKGVLGYVLENHENMIYVVIQRGDMFGLIDVMPDGKPQI